MVGEPSSVTWLPLHRAVLQPAHSRYLCTIGDDSLQGVGVTKHLSGALPGTRRHLETLSWWAGMYQVRRVAMLREGRVVEIASLKQPFIGLSQKSAPDTWIPWTRPTGTSLPEVSCLSLLFHRDSCLRLSLLHLVLWAAWADGKEPLNVHLSVRNLVIQLNSPKYGTNLNIKHTTEKMRCILACGWHYLRVRGGSLNKCFKCGLHTCLSIKNKRWGWVFLYWIAMMYPHRCKAWVNCQAG